MGYAIKIEGLSKCYRISHLAQSGSLRDALDDYRTSMAIDAEAEPDDQDGEDDDGEAPLA